MKRLALVALFLATLALALVPATAAEPTADPAAPAVAVEKGVAFTTIGREKLQFDIATPPGDGPFPCVVCLHGGAWSTGSRRDFSSNGKDKNGKASPSWIEVIASKGYVAVAVSYRLAPKHKFPAMVEDSRAAVRFLRTNAKAHKIDADKFAALGFSAGGHLALLLGLCDKSAGFDVGDHLDANGQVQCVVNFFGPTDLALYAKSEGIEDGYLVPVFGKAAKTDPTVYKKASPMSYVSKNAPPILFLHGTFDLIVPVKHSEMMHKALVDAGAKSELFTVPFAGHGGWNGRDMTRAQETVFAFLDTHLKEKEKK
jgi:acetyl esterase/lipase